MGTKLHPTVTLTKAQPSWDGGHECFDVVTDSETIAQLYKHRRLYVIEEEQRGTDPTTGREVISEDKQDRWYQQEISGRFHVGQLTFCVRSETGGSAEYDENAMELSIHGDLVLSDSRQRTYTLVKAIENRERGNGYKPRFVSVRVYPETTPEYRKRLFYD